MAGKGSLKRFSARKGGGRELEHAVAVASGAAASTNIPVTGIKTTDQLISVIRVPASAAMTDITSSVSITSAGNIQSTVVTTGDQLLVFYWSV